ncbi:MAG: MATE family efflux transporter [Chitinophagales bacterium]|nr:MATE family efflux transporter [Chitinophagales bacterium]MDW8393354.1 MATE family efflux transporter [Chitinophagales bacterium]
MADSYLSYRNILRIALPMVLGSLGQNLIQFADTAFLGRLGEIPLGAVALGGVFYFVVYLVGHAFNTGMQIIAARRAGEGQKAAVGRTVDHQLVLMGLVALLLFGFLAAGSGSLFPLLVRSEALQQEAINFLQVRGWGIFFGLANSAMMAFFLAVGHTRVNLFSTLAMASVNVFLDYVLIFGRLGMPAMGIAGAALASVISEGVATAIFLLYLINRGFHREYGLFRFQNMQWTLMRHTIWLAAPLVAQNLISVGTWFLFFVAIEQVLGKTALAISNIGRSLYTVAGLPVWALGSTVSAMTSHLIGQGRAADVFRLLGRISLLSFGYSLVAGAAMAWLPEWAMRLYTEDPLLLAQGVDTVRVVALATVSLSVSVLFIFAVSGTGSTHMALLIEIICIFLYVFYLWFVISQTKASLPLFWLAEVVYWVAALALCAAYLKYGRWKYRVV